jgi:acyl carrier protein
LGSIVERMQVVFRDVFDDDELVLRNDMTAAEVENWDSLTHINLIVGIEREFKVKFTTAEVGALNNAGDLTALVQKKLGGAG